jgi:MFS family permease
MLCALTVPMALAAVPGGSLSERIGARKTTLIGLFLSMIGFISIWLTWDINVADGLVAVQLLMVGIGLGITFSPISASVINAADENHRGVASAMVIVLRLVGMTLSVSTLTTIALFRVNTLLVERVGVITGLDTVSQVASITVDVLAELGLLAAVLCGIALIPAALMSDDRAPGAPH